MAEFSFYDFCQQENGTIEGYNEVAIDEEVNEMWHDYFHDNARRINEWNESDYLDRFTAENIDTIYEIINRNYEPVPWLVEYTAKTAKELGTPAHGGNLKAWEKSFTNALEGKELEPSDLWLFVNEIEIKGVRMAFEIPVNFTAYMKE